MSALATLFSHRRDVWEWKKASSGDRDYVLHHQRTPADASAATRSVILQRFAESVRELHRISQLGDEARTTRIKTRPDLTYGGSLGPGTLDLLKTLRPADVEALVSGAEVGLDPARTTVRGKESLTLGVTGLPPVPDELKSTPAFLIKWTTGFVGPVLWLRNE